MVDWMSVLIGAGMVIASMMAIWLYARTRSWVKGVNSAVRQTNSGMVGNSALHEKFCDTPTLKTVMQLIGRVERLEKPADKCLGDSDG